MCDTHHSKENSFSGGLNTKIFILYFHAINVWPPIIRACVNRGIKFYHEATNLKNIVGCPLECLTNIPIKHAPILRGAPTPSYNSCRDNSIMVVKKLTKASNDSCPYSGNCCTILMYINSAALDVIPL